MLVKVLEWLSYRTVKKNYDDMLSRFHLIPERNRRTDRRTHLLYQYRASVCWRAIKIQSRFNFRQFDNKLFAVYSKMILQPYEMQMTDSLLLCLSLGSKLGWNLFVQLNDLSPCRRAKLLHSHMVRVVKTFLEQRHLNSTMKLWSFNVNFQIVFVTW